MRMRVYQKYQYFGLQNWLIHKVILLEEFHIRSFYRQCSPINPDL